MAVAALVRVGGKGENFRFIGGGAPQYKGMEGVFTVCPTEPLRAAVAEIGQRGFVPGRVEREGVQGSGLRECGFCQGGKGSTSHGKS